MPPSGVHNGCELTLWCSRLPVQVCSSRLGKTAACAALQGVVLAARALVAAGACRIVVPNDYDDWDLRLDLTAPAEQRAEQLEAFVARMRASGVHPKYGLQLLSAHQMGSCRMGSSPR